MRRFVVEVRVVGFGVLAEVDFVEQVGFDQQPKSAVDGSSGGFGVCLANALP